MQFVSEHGVSEYMESPTESARSGVERHVSKRVEVGINRNPLEASSTSDAPKVNLQTCTRESPWQWLASGTVKSTGTARCGMAKISDVHYNLRVSIRVQSYK